MKKLIFTLLIALGSLLPISAANDIETLKAAIISQLLSENNNDLIVGELAQKYFPNGVDTDQCLMELVAHALPSDEAVEELIQSQNADGSWDGIYYTSPARSAWEAQVHVKNVVKIARSYKAENSHFYGDPKLLDALNRSIEYWCDGGFVCANWWHNCIGIPKILAPALLLLEDELSPELMAKAIKVLDPADERVMTGQNKVWLNGVTFIKGLLLKDTAILERTTEAIRSELKVSAEEGIQYDWSFHQHGAMQQFGNYGLAFASSLSYWMRIFDGTAYDFSAEQKAIMHNYMTCGLNVTIWNGFMDVSSCGRQLFVNTQAGKAASLLTSNLNMMSLDGTAEEKAEYEAYIVRNYIEPVKNNLKGNFTYPISKYTIHRADDFFFSVKMFSTRIIGGEVTNNENLKGYHLADGATMIYRTGKEYENIFPFWDGKYMPGTTVELNDKPLKPMAKGKYLNGSDFVGCMGEGMFGVAALEYRRDGVEANKSWFFFSDEIVCLGNGIKAESGDPMITTLNQCRYQDAAYYLSGKKITEVEKEKLYSATKVFSDGVGYESLDGAAIEFVAREQSGDWHSVAEFYPSTPASGEVFMAQIKHDDSYAYVVRPSADRNNFLKAKGSKKQSFKVLRNDSVATAVESEKEDLVMVVFWSAGEVESSSCGTISSSEPMMMMVSREGGEIITKEHNPMDYR